MKIWNKTWIGMCGLVLLTICPATRAERYRWTGAVSSNYYDVGNWVYDSGSAPATALPTLNDITMFHSDATIFLSSDAANPSLSQWIAVRRNTDTTNHVTFSSGFLTAQQIVVAGGTDGILTVGKGADISVSREFLVGQGNAKGFLYLDGGKIASTVNLQVSGKSGLVEITDGGTLSTTQNVLLATAEAGTATLSLSGAGSVLTTQQIQAATAKNSTASLAITDGAKISATNQIMLGGTGAANTSEGASATLLLSGLGSELKTTSRMGISSGHQTTASATVSDDALLECDHLLVGHMTNSTKGTLDVSGGATIRTTTTTDGYGLFVGNGANSIGIATFSGTSTLLETNDVIICNNDTVTGQLNVLDGAIVRADEVRVGAVANSQSGSLVVENAALELTNRLTVGHGNNSSASATFRDTVSVNSSIYVGYGANSQGTLRVHQGTLLIGTHSVGTMGTTSDLLVGSNNTTGSVEVVDSIVNSRYIILGGNISSLSTSGSAVLNLVNSKTCGNTTVGSTGTLNFIGNSQYCSGVAGWTPRTFTLKSGGTLNFLATREGLGKFTNTNFHAEANSQITLGVDHGVTLLNAGDEVSYTLVTATGNFQWENANVAEGIWNVAVDSTAKTVTATLNEDFRLEDYAMNSGWQSWGGKSRGWLEIDGNFQQNYALELAVSGAEGNDLQALVEWLDDGYDTFSATLNDSGNILLSALEWSQRESQIFAWDFTSYNPHLQLTGLRGYDVPEPSTWLLFLGMFGSLLFRVCPLRQRCHP
ncbi:MAG: hypothetical protein Q4D62_11035 [Planctomycetia bacterium]|nr:hypothetical protein [Planctomycetia bacterium]